MSEVKKATRSRRVDGPKGVVSKTGITVTSCHCRFCMNDLNVTKFYQATDTFLDKSGFMSVCKDCISKIYVDFYRSEKSMEKVLLRMCRMLNVRYGEDAVNATRLHIQTQNKTEDDETIFGIYKSKVVSTMKENVNATSLGLDMTFHEIINNNILIDSLSNLKNNTNLSDEKIVVLRQTWGEKLTIEDYQWLEFELSKWKPAEKKIARNEETLLQLIVLKLFDIRKARNEEKDTTSLEVSYQKLLDSSGLRPKDISISAINNQENYWGGIVAMIEKTTPAEYYKDKKLFANFDGLLYIKNYIIRSIINLITFSKNFNLENEISDQDNYNYEEMQNFDNGISSDVFVEETDVNISTSI